MSTSDTTSSASSRKCDNPPLNLVSKLDGFDDAVNAAFHVPKEDGIITISDDRTVRVWMKRYTGKYWPTICQSVPAAAVCMDFVSSSFHLVVGLENGTLMEFIIADDYNKLTHLRDYLAHQARVAGVVIADQLILSCASDKSFMSFSRQTGQRLCGYQLTASCTCIKYDAKFNQIFIGDAAGQVTFLKLSATSVEKMSTLKKHTGSILCMEFDSERRVLYSASADQSIIVWDVSSPDFATYELHGHQDRVQSILLCRASNRLLSSGEDLMLGCWLMDPKRDPPPKWHESDECESCSGPFFWNVKLMWESKSIGGRQHHCRNCGKALCAKCTANTATIPKAGYECLVRVCSDCRLRLEEAQQPSWATFHEVRHNVTFMHFDESKKLLLTVGKDRIIKLWDVSDLMI